MVKQRHEQWRDEQQRLLEAQTETKLAKEDDMRELARKDAQIDERIRALQIRRLRQEQQIHNEVASLTGEKRVAAKAEAQRLISSRNIKQLVFDDDNDPALPDDQQQKIE